MDFNDLRALQDKAAAMKHARFKAIDKRLHRSMTKAIVEYKAPAHIYTRVSDTVIRRRAV